MLVLISNVQILQLMVHLTLTHLGCRVVQTLVTLLVNLDVHKQYHPQELEIVLVLLLVPLLQELGIQQLDQ